jgi:hypothetical protein
METKPAPRLTIKYLNELYPDFQVERIHKGYTGLQVIHKPTGKVSCGIINALATAKFMIDSTIESPDWLNIRSHYRLPNG